MALYEQMPTQNGHSEIYDSNPLAELRSTAGTILDAYGKELAEGNVGSRLGVRVVSDQDPRLAMDLERITYNLDGMSTMYTLTKQLREQAADDSSFVPGDRLEYFYPPQENGKNPYGVYTKNGSMESAKGEDAAEMLNELARVNSMLDVAELAQTDGERLHGVEVGTIAGICFRLTALAGDNPTTLQPDGTLYPVAFRLAYDRTKKHFPAHVKSVLGRWRAEGRHYPQNGVGSVAHTVLTMEGGGNPLTINGYPTGPVKSVQRITRK